MENEIDITKFDSIYYQNREIKMENTTEIKIPDRMLQFFTYSHLPEDVQVISKPFCILAEHIVSTLPSNPERTVALRKLLESKDCAVRAFLFK